MSSEQSITITLWGGEGGRIEEGPWLVTLTPGEDGYIVAEVPSLPGCISQGKTEVEAISNIHDAIRLWREGDGDKGHSDVNR